MWLTGELLNVLGWMVLGGLVGLLVAWLGSWRHGVSVIRTKGGLAVSYCLRDDGDSDVSLLLNEANGLITCFTCGLHGLRMSTFTHAADAVVHLMAHRRNGERVPEYAIAGLLEEANDSEADNALHAHVRRLERERGRRARPLHSR